MAQRPALRAVPSSAPRAIIYLRQSHYREESISLELQEIACRDYCERQGYAVIGVESDPGISGRTWRRPAVQRAMQAIEDRDADVVVLWKWSRLSRSRKDWALAIDRADLAGGRIESATEPIDTATASGRFARGVMTEYAAFQSEQIGEQWEEVRQRRLRLGLPASGRLPFGWRWIEGGIEPDPDQAPVVVEMYRRYLSGAGSASIAAWLNSQGIPGPNGRPWTRARPFTVMDSPIHAGLIPYRGETHPGAHAPIIDTETWDAYRHERGERTTTGTRPREYEHLLSMLMRCTCGGRMHGKGSITAGKWYGGYLCSARSGHTSRAYVSALRIDPAVTDWLMTFDTEVRPPLDDGLAQVKTERILREMNALEDELAALTRQLAQGIVPEAAYLRARAQIEGDLAARRDEAREIRHAEAATPTAAEIDTIRTTWRSFTVPEKNRILRQLVSRIDVVDGETATLTTAWGDSSLLHF